MYVSVYVRMYLYVCICMYVYYVPTCVAMKLINYISGTKMSKQETLMTCPLQDGLNFTPILFITLRIKRVSFKEHRYI
jgi:hypothetical protein